MINIIKFLVFEWKFIYNVIKLKVIRYLLKLTINYKYKKLL